MSEARPRFARGRLVTRAEWVVVVVVALGLLLLGSFILEEDLNVAAELLGRRCGRVPGQDDALSVAEKLREVPLDADGAEESDGACREVFEERVGLGAVHLHLGQHGKGRSSRRAVSRRVRLDRRVVVGFLLAKLVGGKGQDLQATGAELGLELVELGVVRRREASLRGHVDDEEGLLRTTEAGQAQRASVTLRHVTDVEDR